MTRTTKLIILDRDGVINYDSDNYIKSDKEWEAIPGSLDAIARLNRGGFRVVIATNQSGLAQGKFDISALHAIHTKMHMQLSQFGAVVDAIFFCPHAAREKCPCRKPAPGLLHEISRRLHVPLYKSIVVGDKLSDMEAALAVNARVIMVRSGGVRNIPDAGRLPACVSVYDDLANVAEALLQAG